MASQLLDLPREIRDMISSIVITNNSTNSNHQTDTFHLNYKSTSGLASNATSSLASTCKQLQAEHSYLLRKAALTPGTKILVPIRDFDFSQLISFIHTLRSHEIQAANRNRNIVVNLVNLNLNLNFNLQGIAHLRAKQQQQQQQNLYDWIETCERMGVEVMYTVQWSSVDGKYLQFLETMVGTTSEGRKIVKALKAKNVRSWSWEGW
ncbi:hypothetical protein CERZMDRAFT_23525, partial [Cercospora zeae-maydis SCOH1-5]